MDATIRVLPDALASQIAAGEVVERPSSVVKELVENALDAAATRCEVSVRAGGIASIAVLDDGNGMTPADAELCLKRHATSKLRHFEDLHSLVSYGFRGEALPSIASVSRFILRTRARGAEAGVELSSDAGAETTVKPIGMAPGTSIEVNDLFYNVPARRKFLRSTGTESGHVTETVELAALSRPDVSFTVLRDGRKAREWLRTHSRAERVRQLLGEQELAECLGERGPLRVEAYLSSPEQARQGAQGLKLLVNNRPVRHRAIAASIAHAYGSVLERGRYPRGVVFVDLAPALVDINVHPQKAEVRFANARAVTDAVYGIVSKALAQSFALLPTKRESWGRSSNSHEQRAPAYSHTPTPSASNSQHAAKGTPGNAASVRTDEALADSSPPQVTRPDSPQVTRPDSPQVTRPDSPQVTRTDSTEPPFRAPLEGPLAAADVVLRAGEEPSGTPKVSAQWSSLKFLAQVRQMYLVCQSPEGICVLDQHAAAERVMFSKLRSQYQAREVASQTLLFPVTLQLSHAEVELLETRSNEIQAMGLEVRGRGRDMVSVHSVPKLLQQGSAERLLRDLLNELARTGARGFSDAIDKALATMACHAAVRAGDPVGQDQAEALLLALEGTDFAGYCPHGRPIVAFLSWAELERRVGRR